MKVYVKSKDGRWLMPTHPAKARILLKQGKAKVISRTPFVIQLTYETTTYTQPIIVGIDDGSINIGIAAVSGDKVLYQEEMTVRNDIKSKLDTRRQYRRSRRSRKIRYRKPRFLNRKQSILTCKVCGGNTPKSKIICRKCLSEVDGVHQKYSHIKKTEFRVPPSIKAKKDAIIRTVRNIPLPTPVLIRLEDCYFDFQAIENPEISGENYQRGELFYHRNYKTACKTRDGFKCRVCGTSDNLGIHHIKHRRGGGTDRLSNLMTLCKDCHWKHHNEKLKLPKQKSGFYVSAAHVQQGKNYLQYELSKIAKLETTFGYTTSYYRRQAELEKSHVNDAVMIANPEAKPLYYYFKSVCKQYRKRSLHEATARKGRKTPNRTQKRNNKNVFSLKGFYRYDVVRYKGRIGFISGFAGSNAARIIDVDGNYIKNPTKSYTNVNLSELERLHKTQGKLTEIRVSIPPKPKGVGIP